MEIMIHDCKPLDWQEGYYGWECKHCEAFIPFGCEPWMPEDEYDWVYELTETEESDLDGRA